jgi:hypothetical protein
MTTVSPNTKTRTEASLVSLRKSAHNRMFKCAAAAVELRTGYARLPVASVDTEMAGGENQLKINNDVAR